MAREFGMYAMTDHVQSEMPKDDSVDVNRRWFVKGLITGAAGLAFTTAATTSAIAKRRRKKGQGQSQTRGGGGRGRH
jgi:hypothetical protein